MKKTKAPSPTKLARDERDKKDAAIIEAHADRLNKEALDVFEYQNLDSRSAISCWRSSD